MPSKRFLQLLLAAAGITAITIGLGVGISRNASSLARSANLASDMADVDECEAADDDVTIPRRQIVRSIEEVYIVGAMPGGRRTLRRGQETRSLGSEWPWEDFVGSELAFSMDMSLSVPADAGDAGKAGKSAKSGAGKSGKGSKKCHGKSGKSSHMIDPKKGSKSSKATNVDYEWSSEEASGVVPAVPSPQTSMPTVSDPSANDSQDPSHVTAVPSPATSNPTVSDPSTNDSRAPSHVTAVPSPATSNPTVSDTSVNDSHAPSLSPSDMVANDDASETSSPVPTFPPFGAIVPDTELFELAPSTENPTPFPTILKTYSPTIDLSEGYTYPPTIATPAPSRPTPYPTEASAETTPPGPIQTGPPVAPTAYPVATLNTAPIMFAPPRPVNPDATNFPTSGSTPTVSTEVTGPPTKPARDVEPV